MGRYGAPKIRRKCDDLLQQLFLYRFITVVLVWHVSCSSHPQHATRNEKIRMRNYEAFDTYGKIAVGDGGFCPDALSFSCFREIKWQSQEEDRVKLGNKAL